MERIRKKLFEKLGRMGVECVQLQRGDDGRINLGSMVDMVNQGDRVFVDLDGVVMPSCRRVFERVWKRKADFLRRPIETVREEGRVGFLVWRDLSRLAKKAEVVVWTSRIPIARAPVFLGRVSCFPIIDVEAKRRMVHLGLRVETGKSVFGYGSLADVCGGERPEGRVISVGSGLADFYRAIKLPVDVYFDGGGLL